MIATADLEHWFTSTGPVLLGYSGGVDSSLLGVVGRRVLGRDGFLAAIGISASYPEEQWRAAREVAASFDIPLVEVLTDELNEPGYRANTPLRCYHCKRELWTRLGELAVARGIGLVIDGTNAEDLAGHRPGFRAGRESGIRSPLLELGWRKDQVRSAAFGLGIPVWNAPASPCLSSRIQYGIEVTAARLKQVEHAEAFLRGLGVRGDLRVRHHDDRASVEVLPDMFPLVDAAWANIEGRLRELGFRSVTRDPRGYRRGSLLPLAS